MILVDQDGNHSKSTARPRIYEVRLPDFERVSELVTEGKALLDKLSLDLLEEDKKVKQQGKKLNINQVSFALKLRNLIRKSSFSKARIYKKPDVNLTTISQEGRKQMNGYQGMNLIAGGYITWFSKIGSNWQLNYSKLVDW